MSERLRDRVARRAATAILRRIGQGRLTLVEGGRQTELGHGTPLPSARADVYDARAWSGLLGGSNGVARAYANGWWDSPDLVELVRLAARNMGGFDRVRRRWHPVLGRVERLAGLVPRNTRRRARKHIAAHYDLGNELFSSFLDERLVYSCAYFPTPEATLDEAQVAKLDRVCERLRLSPSDHLLEIGTGWGGLAIHAASEYGCRVTTTTISREQREYATRRVAELGLAERITLLDRDYRDLTGEFDKLASIEMIEAVGWQYFETFFRTCSERLRSDGLMFLQAIVIDNELYEPEKTSRSFANTMIFPGGCLPSERVIVDLVSGRTDMRPAWSDDITAHYAETLRLWRERFHAAAEALERRGYDRGFRRLWDLYLAFSEGGFRERRIRDVQFLFAKPEALGGADETRAAEPALV